MKPLKQSTPIADTGVLDFMTSLAEFMLEAGLTIESFSKVVQTAYVRAASKTARFSNSKVNQSAVAAMTGLTRVQVRTLLKREKAEQDIKVGRIERLVAGWVSDSAFSSKSGAPKKLSRGEEKPSFQQLVKKYGADVPHKALLLALQRRQLVEISDEYVTLTKDGKRLPALRKIGQLFAALDRVMGAERDGKSRFANVKLSTFEANYPSVNKVGQVLIQRQLEQSIRNVILDIEAVGQAVSMDSSAVTRDKRKQTRTTILVATN
jgi:Family of unknown function (DUF6502)